MSEREAEDLQAQVVALCPAGVAVVAEWRAERGDYCVTLSALDRDGKPWEVDWKIDDEVPLGDEQRVAESVRELLRMLSEVVGGELVMPDAKPRVEVTPCGSAVSWKVVARGEVVARGLAADRAHAEVLAERRQRLRGDYRPTGGVGGGRRRHERRVRGDSRRRGGRAARQLRRRRRVVARWAVTRAEVLAEIDRIGRWSRTSGRLHVRVWTLDGRWVVLVRTGRIVNPSATDAIALAEEFDDLATTLRALDALGIIDGAEVGA